MDETPNYRVFVVSDGTGGTAHQALKAAMTQFADVEVEIRRFAHVRSEREVADVVYDAARAGAVVVHTLVTDQLRHAMVGAGREQNVETIDLMGPLLARLSHHFAISPAEKPGLFRQLNQAYFRRIETMEFAFSHDDGLRAHELDKAEIVLVGVSRTFKTPLSVYLAFKGWFVANVPIVHGTELPAALEKVPSNRVFGLDTSAILLAELRQSRADYLGGVASDYSNVAFVQSELEHARRLFQSHPGWHVVSVMNKPIEEIASEILAIKRQADERAAGSEGSPLPE